MPAHAVDGHRGLFSVLPKHSVELRIKCLAANAAIATVCFTLTKKTLTNTPAVTVVVTLSHLSYSLKTEP